MDRDLPGRATVVWTAPSVRSVVACMTHHLTVTAVITVLIERVRPRDGRHRALLVVLSHVTQIGGEVTRVVPHRRSAAAAAPRVITRRLSLLPGFPLSRLALFAFLSFSLLANLLLQSSLVLGFFRATAARCCLASSSGPPPRGGGTPPMPGSPAPPSS